MSYTRLSSIGRAHGCSRLTSLYCAGMCGPREVPGSSPGDGICPSGVVWSIMHACHACDPSSNLGSGARFINEEFVIIVWPLGLK